MPVAITTWAYGDVAEILHIGSYSTEQPDIERLRAFIDSRGYRVIGDHEEEYVKGPGMIFAGDPKGTSRSFAFAWTRDRARPPTGSAIQLPEKWRIR